MISLLRRSLVLLLAAAPAVAQRILVVDRLNRPGAQFTDLPAAEAAAQDGDTLQLRSDGGAYTAIQTTKAVSIVCDIGQAMIRSSAMVPFQISNIPINRTFALKGCAVFFDRAFGPGPALQISYCQGRVNLDSIELGGGQPQLDILFSSVTMKESRMVGLLGVGMSAFGCFLDVSACQFQGSTGDSRFAQAPTEGVALDACDANFSACGISGGQGDQGFAPSPALTVRNSRLDVGSSSTSGFLRAGNVRNGGNGSASAVLGQSSLVRVDPAVAVIATNGAPLFSGIVPVMAPVPSLDGFGIRFLTLRYRGVPGEASLTLFGLPAGPNSIPGFAGGLWIDPQVMFVQAGVVDTLQFQIPIGLTVVAQVLSVAATGLEFSNAVAITGR